MDTYGILNEVLVRLFRDIMDIEQQAIITSEFNDLTNNDMHVIDAIGIDSLTFSLKAPYFNGFY